MNDVLFQPIFEVAGDQIRMYGLECLPREWHAPAMERIETSVSRAAALRQSLQIHVNVPASIVAGESDFAAFLVWTARAHQIELNRLVLEIVEDGRVTNRDGFRRTVSALRAEGVGVALDEVGGERSTVSMILECRPDYFKLDAQLVAGVHQDPVREAMVRSIAMIAARVGAQVIADGVEAGPDMAALRGLRVNLLQGSWLARPRGEAAAS